MIDAQDKSIADRKRLMVCSALQSLIELYRDKQQDAIAEKFEKLRNNMWRSCKTAMVEMMGYGSRTNQSSREYLFKALLGCIIIL